MMFCAVHTPTYERIFLKAERRRYEWSRRISLFPVSFDSHVQTLRIAMFIGGVIFFVAGFGSLLVLLF
jgi:hypothetical protein